MPVTTQPGDFIPTELQKIMCCYSWIFFRRKPPPKEDLPPIHKVDETVIVRRHVQAFQSAVPAMLSHELDSDFDDGNSDVSEDTEISDFIRGMH
ncbi:hypothetical protein EmuJ_000446100 [Echinococcus multilocularis]|uniref:Uncharacterized protein n=1 Tax=Echinococcus multilocularis TaxID=6211 RepID=A0A068XYB4_ECHMU|nr:hypothetical protein EmuJ_000446100 [Echinococcus multilocularis]